MMLVLSSPIIGFAFVPGIGSSLRISRCSQSSRNLACHTCTIRLAPIASLSQNGSDRSRQAHADAGVSAAAWAPATSPMELLHLLGVNVGTFQDPCIGIAAGWGRCSIKKTENLASSTMRHDGRIKASGVTGVVSFQLRQRLSILHEELDVHEFSCMQIRWVPMCSGGAAG